MTRTPRSPTPILAALLASLLLVMVALGCGDNGTQEAAAIEPTPAARAAERPGETKSAALRPPIFSPTSFWNEPLPADAPLDPASAELTTSFDKLVTYERAHNKGPSIATTRWSVPLYLVPAGQRTVRVSHNNPNGFSPALQAAWQKVPLPARTKPAAGSDHHLVVWQPSTDRLWEFWKMGHDEDGWYARWGGAMRHVSTNSGVYGPGAWPGATSSWGATASSLSLAGGLITLEDLERGEIDHAVAFSSPQVRAGVFSSPARRTDGVSTNHKSLPEGAHLRLDPHLDLSTLQMPPFTRMLAQAVQRYGMILRSQSGVIDFVAQDPTPTGRNPYKGPGGFFEGALPNELLASFPWSHLQLLKMTLRHQ